MNWDAAIKLNSTALLRLLARLFEMVGVEVGESVQRLPRRVHLEALRLLRSAEFALRRLIVVEARGLSIKTPAPGSGAAHPFPAGGIEAGSGERAPLFSLYDPRPRVGMSSPVCKSRFEPRITVFGWDDDGPERIDPVEPVPPSPDDLVGAARLCRRIKALRIALADMPKQALRLARAEARRRTAPPGPKRVSPLRPGWPTALRKRGEREVDVILKECHILAWRSLNPPEP